MAFEFDLNKVKESLVNAGKEVESMAKDASVIAKIKIDIHNKEVFLEKQYALLGKAFYEAHKDEEVEEQVYFTSIKEAQEELAKLNDYLDDKNVLKKFKTLNMKTKNDLLNI